MNVSASSFEGELRLSPKPVLIGLLTSGCLTLLFAEMLFSPWQTVSRAISFFLLLSALSFAGWLLVNWRPLVGRWFTVLALMTTVHLAGPWLGLPGSLVWAVIPAAFAVPLLGFRAAAVAAGGESVLLVTLACYPAIGFEPSEAFVAIVATWAVFGAMYGVYYPVRRRSVWLDEYFERAQRFLKDARDRRSELEKALGDLGHANRQLALANERMAMLRTIAEEAQRAKTTFVSSVSHEFRTPLNMIIGLVELMVETPDIYDVVLSPKMQEDLAVVHRNCEHLSEMIDDVLDLTQMEVGRLTVHRERVDLREIVEAGVEVVRPLLEKKQLDLQVTIPDALTDVYCDRTRIRQVILNLMSNAARFTEEGSIMIEVGRQDHQVLVRVTDTGPGISPEDAGRVFEPFWQATGHLWRDKGGSGLGLSVSKRFIELHGGRMWLESEPGLGTSFFFTLPTSAPVEHIVRPGHKLREDWVWREQAFKAGQSGATDQLARPRVVICDETGELYPRFVRTFDQVEFVDAGDPAQARRTLQQCPATALVLNRAAPDDLWALVETASQQAPGTPVIGCSVPRLAERATKAGALGHLVKPIIRADLDNVLEAVGGPVRRVLLVDDDLEFLQLLERMLHACDSALEVVKAPGGEDALDELHRVSPDLMLLDIVMPDMSGWEVLEAMAGDEEKDVPTFLVSGQDPLDRPPSSELLLATIDGGVSLNKVLRCSLEISGLFLEPERGLDLAPG